ncbi:hypothetical protein BDZ94DRAFT_1248102 [Collybia nuda]|uniref:DUF6533 domain-containing protein n=1 Tax=Collybia nuda TaxID=64659 RepID=A0A9P5YG01_9AGAR|nr:hypothetical protein BDZ94DRAFT_1248102 [Collybia nuda]
MDLLIKSAELLQIPKYVDVAASTVLIFDYFQTFEMEVDLIWRSKWSVGKALFFVTRYPCFVDTAFVLYDHFLPTQEVSHETCLKIDTFTDWSAVIGIAAAEAIVGLRTYALWGNNRRILIILSISYTITFITSAVILITFLRSLRYGDPPLPTVGGCYQVDGSKVLFVDYALLILMETLIMVLTIWVGIKRFRHSHNHLITVLYRDGIFYFVYLFLVSAANVIVILAGPDEFVDLFNSFQRIMHSVLSARIMLHMREAARTDRPEEKTTDTSLIFMSAETRMAEGISVST